MDLFGPGRCLGLWIVSIGLMSGVAAAEERSPAKIDVATAARSRTVNDPVPLQIRLRDAQNQPAAAEHDIQVKVDIKSPSGLTDTMNVRVQAGQSGVDLNWKPPAPGIFQVKASEQQNALLDGAGAVLVRPAPPVAAAAEAAPSAASHPAKKKVSKKLKPAPPKKSSDATSVEPERSLATRWRASEVLLAQTVTEAAGGPTSQPTKNRGAIDMQVSARDILGLFADGQDAAKVDVFFVTDDGTSAPSDISVWFHWQGGEVKPQPLVIKKGDNQAQALWTAQAPVEGKLRIAAVSPSYSLTTPVEVVQKFVLPIRGLKISGVSTMAVVDLAQLLVQFEDFAGNAVQLDAGRSISFVAETTAVGVAPQSHVVSPGEPGAFVNVTPKQFGGQSVVLASTAGFPAKRFPVQITWVSVLLLALLGGCLGGLLRFYRSKGNLLRRLTIGLVVGCVAVFGYVTGLLPSTSTQLLHNQIAVPIAALVAGWVGLEMLDRIPGVAFLTGAGGSPAPKKK